VYLGLLWFWPCGFEVKIVSVVDCDGLICRFGLVTCLDRFSEGYALIILSLGLCFSGIEYCGSCLLILAEILSFVDGCFGDLFWVVSIG
jgi:hypothetical protein